MKKILLIVGLICLGLSVILFVKGNPLAKGPALNIITPSLFASLETGGSGVIELIVRNDGDTDLILKNFVTSCGCIRTIGSAKIGPKSVRRIAVSYRDLAGKGNRAYSIAADTNDRNKPLMVVPLTLKVLDEVEVIFLQESWDYAATEPPSCRFTAKVNTNNDHILNCKVNTTPSWVQSNVQVIDGVLLGDLKLVEGAPCGQTDVLIAMELDLGTRKISKQVRHAIRKRGSIHSNKPYSIGIITKSKRFEIDIPIFGSDLTNLDAEFVGMDGFKASIQKQEGNESLAVKIDPMDYKYSQTVYGYIKLTNSKTNVIQYVHPFYVRTD